MEDIIVRLASFPHTVGGVTVVDENGDYNVYLNDLRGDQEEVYAHELGHIRSGDFCNRKPITETERPNLMGGK